MSLKRQVFSVLVVSAVENFNTAMSSMLRESDYKPVKYASSIGEAQRAIADRHFDFVIINAPLKDDLGVRFAIDCSTSHSAVVLLLIQNEIHAEVYGKVTEHGVFTLPKPMSKQTMTVALMWMRTAAAKVKKYEKKTTSIEDKMQEIRLINKAKWKLIDEKNMTEPEAHRYIEKTAMDRCMTKAELAKEILK